MKFCAAICLILILGCGCSKEEKLFPIPDSQISVFNYLPSETQFITYMNLSELRATELWDNFIKHSLEENKENNWLTEFESETGFGLNRGVKEIYISSTWSGNNGIAVLFDENTEKVKEFFLESKKFISNEINGSVVYKKTEEPLSFFIFINDSLLLVINDPEYLLKVIDDSHIKTGLNSNTEFISIIEKIENKEQYWIAADNTYAGALLGELFRYNLNEDIRNMFLSLKGFSLSARISSGVELKSILFCKDAKSAYIVAGALKGSVMLDLLSEEDPAVNKILNKMIIERNAGNVNISITLNSKDVKELKSLSNKNDVLKKL